MIFRGDRKRPFLAGLILLPIGFNRYVKEMLHRRNDDLFHVPMDLSIADHHRPEIDIGHVALVDGN